MTFWDSSAIVALLLPQVHSGAAREHLARDPALVVWAWTPVECLSALRRLERDGVLDTPRLFACRERLADLQAAWAEVSDYDRVRSLASRCLLLHPLRAGDAGQLAAALIVADAASAPLPFLTFDRRLADAARREGLQVL